MKVFGTTRITETRARIAAWVADPDVPQDESHAHH